MTQNRPPPAFQEYAASMMAKTDYRVMSLAGRGLLYSMRLECWVNHSLPREVAKLAKVLGFDPVEVSGAIDEVVPFYADEYATLYLGDALDVLPTLPDHSVDFSVFSPPFSSTYTYSPSIANPALVPPSGLPARTCASSASATGVPRQ